MKSILRSTFKETLGGGDIFRKCYSALGRATQLARDWARPDPLDFPFFLARPIDDPCLSPSATTNLITTVSPKCDGGGGGGGRWRAAAATP
jgi:hypothetical protein